MPTPNKEITTKSFITEDFDKFTDKRTVYMNWPEPLTSVFYDSYATKSGQYGVESSSGYRINLALRYVKTPDLDAVVLDYTYIGADWGWVRDGNLILNLDGGANISLAPVETGTDNVAYKVSEVGYYIITKDTLEAICNAKVLEMKLTGSKFTLIFDHSVKNAYNLSYTDKFLFMARAFYMGLYDDDTYMPQIKTVIDHLGAAQNTIAEKQKKTRKGCLILVVAAIGILVLFFLWSKHQSDAATAKEKAMSMQLGDVAKTTDANDVIDGHDVTGYQTKLTYKDSFNDVNVEYYSPSQIKHQQDLMGSAKLTADSTKLMTEKTTHTGKGGTIWLTSYRTDEPLAKLEFVKVRVTDASNKEILEHEFSSASTIMPNESEALAPIKSGSGYLGYGAVEIPDETQFPITIFVATMTRPANQYVVTPIQK